MVGEADTLGSVDTGPGAEPLTLPPVAPFPPEEARQTATEPTSTRVEGHDDGKRVIRDAPFSVDPLPNLELTALPSSGLFSDRPPKLPPLAAASSSKVTRKQPIPDVISMRDFRVVAREIAREEIKLDRDIHPQQSYEDMRASLISEIVPIVSRHMETRIVDGVYQKLRAAFQAELPLFVRDVVLDMQASLPPQSPQSRRSDVNAREEAPLLVPTEPPVQREATPARGDKEHEAARRWVDLMRETTANTRMARDSHLEEHQDSSYPGLEEIKPLNERFTKALSYRTYRLRKRDERYDDEVAQRLAKTARQLKHVMTVPLFTGEDPIAVLAFLKNFKFACDETGVAEGAALPLMKYFMAGEARETMLSYVGRGTGFADARPGIDIIYSYPEAVNWLLLTYAKESVLQTAYRQVTQMRQGMGETEEQFAFRLRKEALRCGDAFLERSLMAIYIDGLSSYSQHVVRDEVSRNPRISFQDVRMRAQSLGDTARETHRHYTRVRNNLIPERTPRKVTTRRVNTISLETEPQADATGSGEIFAVGMEGEPPLSSESRASSLTRGSSGVTRREERTPPTQRQLELNPSDNTQSNGRRVEGYNRPTSRTEYPKTAYPRPQGMRRTHVKCLICRKTGHVMTQCRLLPREVRMTIKDAQVRDPFDRQELEQLRALVVEPDTNTPLGGEEDHSDGDSDASSDAAPHPENGLEEAM